MVTKPVDHYGCVRCQEHHYSDTEPELYKAHLFWQSKHGVQHAFETIAQRRERYDEAAQQFNRPVAFCV